MYLDLRNCLEGTIYKTCNKTTKLILFPIFSVPKDSQKVPAYRSSFPKYPSGPRLWPICYPNSHGSAKGIWKSHMIPYKSLVVFWLFYISLYIPTSFPWNSLNYLIFTWNSPSSPQFPLKILFHLQFSPEITFQIPNFPPKLPFQLSNIPIKSSCKFPIFP